MAKGVRSKVKKRWRSLKRQHLENVKGNQDLLQINEKLLATIQNRPYRLPEPKNAFLYPTDPSAQFPQHKQPQLIDFRSSAIPDAGLCYAGSSRQKKQGYILKRTVVGDDDQQNKDDENDQIIEQEEQKIIIQQDNEDEDNDNDELAAALKNFGIKTQGEKRKQNKLKAMNSEDVAPMKKQIQKKKNQKIQTKKSKKIIKF